MTREPKGSRQPAAIEPGILPALSRPDGFVELFGRMDGPVSLVQGWSTTLPAGSIDLFIETDRVGAVPASVATYERPDLGTAGHGIVALVRAPAGLDFADVRRIHFRVENGWRHLEIFANRTFLSDQEAASHLKGMLPSLRIEPGANRLFRRMADRYAGHETVSALAQPVRAAVDLAVATPEGTLVVGWMLDPCGQVASVSLRATGGGGRRIDDRWCRVARADVSQGFAEDPLFAGHIMAGADDHGFIAFVPGMPPREGDSLYLEMVLADEATAFVPVPVTVPSLPLLHRILSSFDVNEPAAETIIDRQVGPAAMASLRLIDRRGRIRPGLNFGTPPSRPTVSAIIALPPGWIDADLTLARMGVDPDFAGVEVIFVAPGDMAGPAAALLRRRAPFYGLSGRLLLAAGASDRHALTELAAAEAKAELLLFLAPSVFPRRAGWLSQLARNLRAAGAAAISPTLLYEDDSIRFAGGGQGEGGQCGYSRHWLARKALAEAVPASAIASECCLIARAAFAGVGGFANDYIGAAYRDIDLSRRLKAARLACLWAPGVEMAAVDAPEGSGVPACWAEAARLVDRWGFESRSQAARLHQ